LHGSHDIIPANPAIRTPTLKPVGLTGTDIDRIGMKSSTRVGLAGFNPAALGDISSAIDGKCHPADSSILARRDRVWFYSHGHRNPV
jgi:hypothetical protein